MNQGIRGFPTKRRRVRNWDNRSRKTDAPHARRSKRGAAFEKSSYFARWCSSSSASMRMVLAVAIAFQVHGMQVVLRSLFLFRPESAGAACR